MRRLMLADLRKNRSVPLGDEALRQSGPVKIILEVFESKRVIEDSCNGSR